MGNIVSISTIGQDSHRFGEPCGDTFIKLGGTDIPFDRPIEANSDGDVVYHAITNAISGFTGVNILGGEADKICLEKGIKDSSVYLEKALWAGAGELSINARVLWVASGSGALYGLYCGGGEIGGYLIRVVSAVCVAGGGWAW